MPLKTAFVTPWYGPHIPGGAEALTRMIVENLHRAGLPVEVLTTCIRDFHADWGHNDHKPGTEIVNGVPVHRFAVQKRDKAAFDQVNWRLIHNLPVTAVQEQTFINEMMRPTGLYEYMRQYQQEYLFVFIPYMFATTYHGTQICPERSLIIPCLHDESYLRLGIYRQAYTAVRGLLYLTEVETDLANRYLGQVPEQIRQVLGCGVNTDFEADGDRFRQKYGLDNTPILLYAGRREPGKNTPLLLEYWQRYRAESETAAQLVLIGSGDVALPSDSGILDLGFVPTQDKYDAYAAADVFCMPSVHESFSIVIMESWLAGTPVLVHDQCAVTRRHCQLANGGLYFRDYDEFAATLTYLLENQATAVQLGQQGRRYVLQNFHWDLIIEKYKHLLSQMCEPAL